jgi:hypothetical protein
MRLCSEVDKADVDPPAIDMAKYRAVEVGEAPIYLDTFNRATARLSIDTNATVVPRSKSEIKRQTTLRVVQAPPEESQP